MIALPRARFLLLAFACCALALQTSVSVALNGPATEAVRQQATRQTELVSVGVYYYPEQWPHEQWERDFAAMGRLGVGFTHLAEFAWSALEPREGEFDFRWLDEAIAAADRAGLKVILGTPSSAPPAWMGERYPGIYRVDDRGQRHQHGIRAEVSLADPSYQRFVTRIVAAMAKRYGHDRRVWGWQLDNEPGTLADFSEAARRDFQRWLRERYGSIATLNEAWGGQFWSSDYQNFQQVLLPNATLAAEDKLSPHALLDLARFRADQTARFLESQAATLRRHTMPSQWITTNYTNVTTTTDPWRTQDLDFPTFTLYPVQGSNLLGGNSYGIGKPANLMEAAAYYGSARGIFGIMELQPGQVNWGEINPQPLPGAIRLWMWHAFATGASFISTYRYRHPLKGSEMFHEGIVGTDGVTLSRSGREYIDTASELKALAATLDQTAPLPAEFAARSTGMLWSHDNYWDLEISPETKLWNTWAQRNELTLAVRTTGAPLTFIGERDRFEDYPFLVVPAYQSVTPDLVQRWRRYVEQGGHLILSARTGLKDGHGHFPEARFGASIADLVGADLQGFDMLPASVHHTVRHGEHVHPWQRWADLWVAREGTEVMATFDDGYYRGQAAALHRRTGLGSVTVIGVSSEDGHFEREVIREVYRRAHVAIEDLPVGLFLDWRAGVLVATNYQPEPVSPARPAGWRVSSGVWPPPPAGVTLLKPETADDRRTGP